MRYKTDDFVFPCGCRSVGECNHGFGAEEAALEALVDGFAVDMKRKLKEKFRESCYGWDNPIWTEEDIREALHNHTLKGDPVDIANFAAFLWNRGTR